MIDIFLWLNKFVFARVFTEYVIELYHRHYKQQWW